MRFTTVLAVLVGIFGLVEASQYATDCAAGQVISELHLQVYSVEYPILINTFISSNTIINIKGVVSININNAPIYLNTTVFGTSIVTSTITSTITTLPTTLSTTVAITKPATSSINPSASFLIAIDAAPAPTGIAKRQNNSNNTFIYAGGNVGEGCVAAAAFSIINGQLFSGTQQISTNIGVSSAPFILSSIIGNINTTFSIAADTLIWENKNFVGGAAKFCSNGGTILSVFDDLIPARYVVIQMGAVPGSSCPGRTSSSSSSSSSISSTTASSSTAAASSSISTSISSSPISSSSTSTTSSSTTSSGTPSSSASFSISSSTSPRTTSSSTTSSSATSPSTSPSITLSSIPSSSTTTSGAASSSTSSSITSSGATSSSTSSSTTSSSTASSSAASSSTSSNTTLSSPSSTSSSSPSSTATSSSSSSSTGSSPSAVPVSVFVQAYDALNCQNPDPGADGTIESGQCVSLSGYLSLGTSNFNAGSTCGASAAQCEFYAYSDGSCGTELSVNPADSPTCIDTTNVNSVQMLCPC